MLCFPAKVWRYHYSVSIPTAKIGKKNEIPSNLLDFPWNMSLILEKHSDHKENTFSVIFPRKLVDAGVIIGYIRLDLLHSQFVIFMRQPPSICNAAVKDYLQGTFCIADRKHSLVRYISLFFVIIIFYQQSHTWSKEFVPLFMVRENHGWGRIIIVRMKAGPGNV